MVSFQCDQCCDVVKKPKLDAHRARCNASFTCIDCSTTFRGPNEYKSHTSCISEAQKYEKGLYKGNKTGHAGNAAQSEGETLHQERPESLGKKKAASMSNGAQGTAQSKGKPTFVPNQRGYSPSKQQGVGNVDEEMMCEDVSKLTKGESTPAPAGETKLERKHRKREARHVRKMEKHQKRKEEKEAAKLKRKAAQEEAAKKPKAPKKSVTQDPAVQTDELSPPEHTESMDAPEIVAGENQPGAKKKRKSKAIEIKQPEEAQMEVEDVVSVQKPETSKKRKRELEDVGEKENDEQMEALSFKERSKAEKRARKAAKAARKAARAAAEAED